MLLETRKVKRNDFIIYSRNSTDDDYNYRIIFRSDPKLSVRKISLEQVKRLIYEYFPKNLIVYRILTNIPSLSINNRDNSLVINVNNEPELFFTDPVYAVRTVENVIDNHSFEVFRFKIQQVGLSASSNLNGLTVYKDKISYDLKAKEAISINDEILARELLELNKKLRGIRKKVEKTNYIFVPENLKDFVDTEAQKLALGKEDIILKSERIYREKRIPISDKFYNGKELPIDLNNRKVLEEKLNHVNSNLDIRTQDDSTIQPITRERQQLLRNKTAVVSQPDQKNDLKNGYGLTETKPRKDEKLNKIKGNEPLHIRKVTINNDNSFEEVSYEPVAGKGDKLFRNFLESIKNESNNGIRKKRKMKEDDSDIIRIFKSLQRKDILKYKKNDEIILKMNRGTDKS